MISISSIISSANRCSHYQQLLNTFNKIDIYY